MRAWRAIVHCGKNFGGKDFGGKDFEWPVGRAIPDLGPPSDPASAPKASHQPETPRTRPVMGGAPGAVVELQEALRHPERFHVDTAGTVWTRSFWNELRA